MNARKLLIPLFLLIAIITPVSAVWCGDQILYFENATDPDITGYETLINHPSGGAEVIETVRVINTGGPVLIDTYISPPGITFVEQMDRGLWRYRTFMYVDSNVGTTRLNFTPFLRHSDGAEDNLYTVLSDDINSLTVDEYLTSYTLPANITFAPTDRFGIRVSANTTHSSSIGVSWVYEGTTHYSSVEPGYFECPDAMSAYGSGSAGVDAPISPIIPLAAIALIGLIFYKRKH